MIIRFIFGFSNQVKWLPIKHISYLHPLTQLYTTLYHPVTPRYHKKRFKFLKSASQHSQTQTLRLRNNNFLKAPLYRTKCYGDSFTEKTIKLWNELLLEVRRFQSFEIYERRLKQRYHKLNL